MSNRGYVMITILVTAAVTGIMPAFAVNELACPDCPDEIRESSDVYESMLPTTVWTDKSAYNQPETIVVSGHVKNIKPEYDITIMVVGPTDNVVTVKQIQVDGNGDFETTLETGSPLWTKSGVYTIGVQYGTDGRSNKVEFELNAAGVCGSSQVAVKAGQETHCITYSITGGTVVEGMLDMGSKSLIVQINPNSNGEITLEIPRSVLDSKAGTKDSRFFVMVNGEEDDIYSEQKTDTARSVTIQFESGVEEIEIIGTKIVPEFGAIAALVLAVAIISIIAVSAKTRIRLESKY